MNVNRTTTGRQTVKMKGKGGSDVVDLIIFYFNIFSSHSIVPPERKEVGEKSINVGAAWQFNELSKETEKSNIEHV